MNVRAILYGLLTSIVIGLLSGLGLPFTDATLPVVGAGLSGLVAGAVAGYVNAGPMISNAVHGGIATVVGGFVVAVLLLVFGTLVAGVFGLTVGVAALVIVAVTAVPGAIGGAIGGMLAGRRDTERARPAA
jgi:membrane associated rhomboid family serine protease